MPTIEENFDGLSDMIYSYTWGDALFIILNPYTATTEKSKDDNWGFTLGEQQYEWLEETLKNSDKEHRFIFVHHLVGGIGEANRGGSEAAHYYEWGGLNPEGSDGFQENRVEFSKPIHSLLVDYDVDIVFHGHDHFYAREVLDGITYQLVPQPSLGERQNIDHILEEYGYIDGEYLSSPGFLNVEIKDNEIIVQMIDSSTGQMITTYKLE